MSERDGEETGEDVALDDSWNYTDILWTAYRQKGATSFDKLNYREQTFAWKAAGNLHDLRACQLMESRPTFEELAVMFGAALLAVERAYRRSSGQTQ